MKTDTANTLSRTSILLHWLIAFLMVSILISGIYMTTWEDYNIYPLHKSFGMLTFGIALIRIFWRIYNGWPAMINNFALWEKCLAKMSHYLLIVGTIMMPISGMIMTSMSGRPLVLFGFNVLNSNVNHLGEVIPRAEFLSNIAHEIHELAGYIIIFVILLHILGALKHHIINKNGILKRMLGVSI